MSLSWNDEQFSPTSRSEVYGNDIKLEAKPVQNVAPTQKPVVTTYHPQTTEVKKKNWLLRPVAWMVLLISVGLMNSVINTTFLLIVHVVEWLSTLPTMAVILLTLVFGGFVLSLMFTCTIKLVVFVVLGSQTIYPSKCGVRYYIVGAVQVFISVLSLCFTITAPGATHTFLDFAAPIYFAILYIVMLYNVKSIID